MIFNMTLYVNMELLSHVQLFVTPWTVAYQAPQSMEFSRQENWSGLSFPSPGDLSNPGIEPGSPALQADALTSEPPGKPLCILKSQFSSVSQSCLTLCDPMYCTTPGFPVHHELPVYPNSCPLSRWWHLTITSSVVPFSSCLQSFPGSGSFQMSQLFASGGQNIGVSASTSVFPVNTQDWFPLGWTGWISLQSKGLSRVFSNTTVQKHQFFGAQLSL